MQNVNDATPTPIQFNNEAFDTGAMHDNVTNNTLITFPVNGTYMAVLRTSWGNSTAGTYRISWIRFNGTTILASAVTAPNTTQFLTRTTTCTIFQATTSDYIEGLVQQNSGGAINLNFETGQNPYLEVIYLGPPA